MVRPTARATKGRRKASGCSSEYVQTLAQSSEANGKNQAKATTKSLAAAEALSVAITSPMIQSVSSVASPTGPRALCPHQRAPQLLGPWM